MQHKFVRADDSVITAVKSVRYTQQAIDNKCIRIGTAFSSCIEVTAYGTGSDVVTNGEEIRYYRVYDVDENFAPISPSREVFVGTFTAISAVPSKDTFSFVAYDDVYKLSADFSKRLLELKSSFPMLVQDLIHEVESVAGITISVGGTPWWDRFPEPSINYFYADGITCRDIISAAFELSGQNIKVSKNTGNITYGQFTTVTDGWGASSRNFIICPTDQITYYQNSGQTIPLKTSFYKENGFRFSDYEAQSVSKVILKKTDGTILKEVSVSGVSPDNEYTISGNVLLDNMVVDLNTSHLLQDCADAIIFNLNKMTDGSSDSYYGRVRNAEAHLFPFRNPYSLFNITQAVDSNGTQFMFPIMKIVETASEVVLYSYTNEYFDNSSQNYNSTDQNVVALSALVNKMGGDIDDINNDIGTINGDITTINTALGNLSYKMYYRVNQLGLTEGSATVTSCWNAMPTQSILIAGAGNFSSSARPFNTAYGQIFILKNTNTNGFIILYGLTEGVGEYRMYLTGSPEAPSETWIPTGFDRYITDTTVVFDDVSVSANNYTDQTPSVSKTGYKVIGVIGCRVQNSTNGGTNGQYCLVAGTWVASDTTIGVRVKNVTGSAAKVKCTATVLYQKL